MREYLYNTKEVALRKERIMNDHDIIHLELPASHKYLHIMSALIDAFLAHHNLEVQKVYNIQLGVQETCANIVDHAYKDFDGGWIKITIYLEKSNILVIKLHDEGRHFDLSSTKPVNLKTPHARGYGLHLINSLFDHVTYEKLENCNLWTLTKQL